MIEIREVKTKKEQKDFINFPLKLYKGNKCFVPPLYSDEKALFKSDFIYNDTCETVYYNAYMDSKIVGRISGIIQKASNEKTNEKRVRFTRFDAIDNQEVANKLFDEVTKWAKEKGMDTICGPLGFSDLEREGLLIEGFNELSTFEEQYNYDYYQRLIENYGFIKEVDWVERRLKAPKEYDYKLEKVSTMMMKKYNLRFGEAKNIKDFIKRYEKEFFEVLDVTYKDLYGTVPFTKNMKESILKSFNLIVNIKHVAVILDENDHVVCFGICFPSLSKALVGTSGRLTPITLIKMLFAIKRPKSIDLGLVGVLPEYEKKGISTAIIAHVMKMLSNGIESAETNLNLEDNLNIQNLWKRFDNVLHKRRRAYIKKID